MHGKKNSAVIKGNVMANLDFFEGTSVLVKSLSCMMLTNAFKV